MSSFRLNRFFAQPEILREIDPDNLILLLADHAAELETLGLKMPDGADSASFDYETLTALLMESDKLPGEVREAFYFVHEMATDEGMECLLDAAVEAGIEIIGKPAPTVDDDPRLQAKRNHDVVRRHRDDPRKGLRWPTNGGHRVQPGYCPAQRSPAHVQHPLFRTVQA